MVSETLKDKFLNEMRKQMVNEQMYAPLLPSVQIGTSTLYVGEYLQKKIEKSQYSKECIISFLEYSEEYGFIEKIYAGKRTKRMPFHWQEIAVMSEKLNQTVSRNCFYKDYGMTHGLTVYGYEGKKYRINSGSWYYSDYDYMEQLEASWLESKHFSRYQMFDIEKIAELDPSVKYCGYTKESGIYFIDYVKLYRKYPIGEMLMKLKLYRMINEKAMEAIQGNKAFQKWLFKHAKEVQYMAYTTAINAFKKQPDADARDYAKSLQYRIECGKKIAAGNRTMTRKLYKYASPEKICKYLEENHIDSRSYIDYITAAEWLQLDFNDTKVLFPKNFKEVHDSYTEQYGRWRDEQEAIQKQKDRISLNMALKSRSEEFHFCAWKHGGFIAVIATSKEDLITEGRHMENCVGKMNYDTRMEKGELVICFVRKADDPDASFITAQVDTKSWKAVQFYGKGNSVVKDAEVLKWRKDWEKHMQKASRKIVTEEAA